MSKSFLALSMLIVFTFSACMGFKKKKDFVKTKSDAILIYADYGFTLGAKGNRESRHFYIPAVDVNTVLVKESLFGAFYRTMINKKIDFYTIAAGIWATEEAPDYAALDTGIMWQIFRTLNNKFGIRLKPILSYRYSHSRQIRYSQLSVDLSTKLYFNKYFFMFSGIQQPLLRKNVYHSTSFENVIDKQNFYGGVGYNLIGIPGFSLKVFTTDKRYILAIGLLVLDIGYDMTEKSFYFKMMDLSF